MMYVQCDNCAGKGTDVMSIGYGFVRCVRCDICNGTGEILVPEENDFLEGDFEIIPEETEFPVVPTSEWDF
jgi:hypothetical protein